MTRRRTATHVSWLALFLALFLASLHPSLAEDAGADVVADAEAGKPNPNDPEVNYDAINPNRPDKSNLFFKPAHIDIEPIASGVIRLDLRGLEAQAACFCKVPERVRKLQNSQCLIPHRITLYKPGTHVDTPAKVAAELPVPYLKQLIGSINEVRLVSSSQASFACVDGRQTHLDSPRTWGGDFGEFVQVLAFMSAQQSKPFKQDAVDSFLATWVDTTRGRGAHEAFYYSTDVDAVMKLTQWMRETYGLVGTQLLDLTAVPDYMQGPVLEGLRQPRHIGSLPVRLMLEFPKRFQVAPAIVHMAHEAYFKMLWRKDIMGRDGPMSARLRFIVSEGYHAEKVFLDVRNSVDCVREQVHSVLTISEMLSDTGFRVKYGLPRAAGAAAGDLAAYEKRLDYQERRVHTQKGNNTASQRSYNGAHAARAGTMFIETDAAVAAQAAAAEGTGSAEGATESAAEGAAEGALSGEGSTAAEAGAASASAWGATDLFGGHLDEFTIASASDSSADATADAADAAAQGVDADAEEEAQSAAAAEAGTATETAAEAEAAALAELSAESASRVSASASAAAESAAAAASAAATTTGSGAESDAAAAGARPLKWADRSDDVSPRSDGYWVPGMRYRPQQGVQAFIFNQQAAMKLRREMLFALMQRHPMGSRQNTWVEYAKQTTANDRIFMDAIAGGLPQYVVYMQ